VRPRVRLVASALVALGLALAFLAGSSPQHTGLHETADAHLFDPSSIISDDLFFNGAGARAANGGRNVPIFAPNPFDDGSSYSHQDEATFPAGNANSLMTPQLGRAEAIHSPGPIGMGILRDIGW